VTVTNNSISGFSDVPINYNTSPPLNGSNTLNIMTGTGNNTVDVQSTAYLDPTTIVGNSDGTLNVGDNGSVQGIQGTLLDAQHRRLEGHLRADGDDHHRFNHQPGSGAD
jgi:hypothetical protein